jgi:putative glutamine amidotransferase
MRVRVGITAHIELINDTDGDALLHFVAAVPYVRAVARAGGLPLLLPVGPDDDPGDWLDTVDAVVVTGGCDVDPAAYGHDPHPRLGAIDPRRDEIDFEVTRAIVARNQPALFVCRGIQVLNVALGGTLVQHVDDHMQPGRYNDDVHTVHLQPGSRLAEIAGTEVLGVNTLHHQVIGDLAAGLREVGRNDDGHIEAVEVDGADRVIGVQWHPELVRHREEHLGIFRWLVRTAAGDDTNAPPGAPFNP